MSRPPLLLLAALISPFLIAARHDEGCRPEPRTAQSVLDASDDWIAAERMGNVAALNTRLADGYRDVDATGRPHSKADLLEHTATRKDIWPGTASDVARAFHQKFPSRKEVILEGDTAIISYHPVDAAREGYVIAEDVFSYQNGMWRGVMSSHFKLEPAARS